MLEIKQYANGKFFDSINKKYIKEDTIKKMVEKGEKIKVILTKTGKDVTNSVLEQFSKKDDTPKKEKEAKKTQDKADKIKKVPYMNLDSLKQWTGKFIDSKIAQVLETIKLPSSTQIEKLDANIKALNKKIDKLEALQTSKTAQTQTVEKVVTPKKENLVESDTKNDAKDLDTADTTHDEIQNVNKPTPSAADKLNVPETVTQTIKTDNSKLKTDNSRLKTDNSKLKTDNG